MHVCICMDLMLRVDRPCQIHTRKPTCRWQTCTTRKHAEIAPIPRAYNVVADDTGGLSVFSLAVVASEICEIPRNSLKIQTYIVQGHPRSSILVSIESTYETSY